MKPALFFEDVGVLTIPRQNISQSAPLADRFQVNHDAIASVRRLKAAGFILIVASNKPELSRGTISRRELDQAHGLLRQSFSLDDIFICPHDDADRCPCRKPRDGLFKEAAHKWHLEMERSFVISDKWQDAEAARSLGCTSVLLQSPTIGKVHRDFLVPNLEAAVDKILHLHGARQFTMA
ncbi:MAG: gmhB 1 [Verrucomicrobiales bacterium]|nr:gmhB 1 [Verrucomicrobiales bacterium]